jgi:hypothetical protein
MSVARKILKEKIPPSSSRAKEKGMKTFNREKGRKSWCHNGAKDRENCGSGKENGI